MGYKCEKCKRTVESNIPQAKIYDKIDLEKGSRITGEHKVCYNCYANPDKKETKETSEEINKRINKETKNA